MHDELELTVRADDENGELVAGLPARTWGGTCEVDMLWVRSGRRAEGWGGKLLQAAETEASRRGCTQMVLSSFTFQAPDFYRGHGYAEIARTGGFVGDHQRVHFLKRL